MYNNFMDLDKRFIKQALNTSSVYADRDTSRMLPMPMRTYNQVNRDANNRTDQQQIAMKARDAQHAINGLTYVAPMAAATAPARATVAAAKALPSIASKYAKPLAWTNAIANASYADREIGDRRGNDQWWSLIPGANTVEAMFDPNSTWQQNAYNTADVLGNAALAYTATNGSGKLLGNLANPLSGKVWPTVKSFGWPIALGGTKTALDTTKGWITDNGIEAQPKDVAKLTLPEQIARIQNSFTSNPLSSTVNLGNYAVDTARMTAGGTALPQDHWTRQIDLTNPIPGLNAQSMQRTAEGLKQGINASLGNIPNITLPTTTDPYSFFGAHMGNIIGNGLSLTQNDLEQINPVLGQRFADSYNSSLNQFNNGYNTFTQGGYKQLPNALGDTYRGNDSITSQVAESVNNIKSQTGDLTYGVNKMLTAGGNTDSAKFLYNNIGRANTTDQLRDNVLDWQNIKNTKGTMGSQFIGGAQQAGNALQNMITGSNIDLFKAPSMQSTGIPDMVQGVNGLYSLTDPHYVAGQLGSELYDQYAPVIQDNATNTLNRLRREAGVASAPMLAEMMHNGYGTYMPEGTFRNLQENPYDLKARDNARAALNTMAIRTGAGQLWNEIKEPVTNAAITAAPYAALSPIAAMSPSTAVTGYTVSKSFNPSTAPTNLTTQVNGSQNKGIAQATRPIITDVASSIPAQHSNNMPNALLDRSRRNWNNGNYGSSIAQGVLGVGQDAIGNVFARLGKQPAKAVHKLLQGPTPVTERPDQFEQLGRPTYTMRTTQEQFAPISGMTPVQDPVDLNDIAAKVQNGASSTADKVRISNDLKNIVH